MPEPLPEYHVKARNTSAGSENRIHDDAVARQYGFRGALVPGVTLYAYLTRPLVQALGAPWLERGTATVRFLRPVHEGEEVTVGGAITARERSGLTATVSGTTPSSGECAVLAATLPAGLPTPANRALYRAAPLPADRPPVSREHLAGLDALGAPELLVDEACANAWLEDVGETLALYRGNGGRVHPALLLRQANRALADNVRLGPWIHVSSAVRHLGGAWVGELLRTLGGVRSLYERKGREHVELDLLIVAGPRARPVAHILHTAIWRISSEGGAR